MYAYCTLGIVAQGSTHDLSIFANTPNPYANDATVVGGHWPKQKTQTGV